MRYEEYADSYCFFRHGHTYFNWWLSEVRSGKAKVEDFNPHLINWRSPLTIEGLSQMMKLGLWIGSEDYDLPKHTRFLTSMYVRARGSAGMIGTATYQEDDFLQIEPSYALGERYYGDINSPSNLETCMAYLESLQERLVDPVGWDARGGENLFGLLQRAESHLLSTRPVDRSAPCHFLESTHGSFIWAIRSIFELIPPEELVKMSEDPLQRIDYGDAVQYRRIGDVFERRICKNVSLPRKGEGWEKIGPGYKNYLEMFSLMTTVIAEGGWATEQ